MKLEVENVLKGNVAVGSVAVYYFTFAGGFDGSQPLGMWKVGNRRVFWLRRDQGVLRTVCDGWDGCTWRVASGAHTHLKFDASRRVALAVADILLTRGEGKIDEGSFASAVGWGAPAPADYLIEKLWRLARTERGAVKNAACSQLWVYAHDDAAPESLRENAEAGLLAAACKCVETPDGGPDCTGFNGHQER